VLVTGNQYCVKSTAVLRILKELGGILKFFYVFIIIPVPVRNFIYNLIAKTRYKLFGKLEQCFVPGPENRERFLH